jgi:hypothetical protein
MTIEQTVEIDRDRRVLRLDQPLPETVGAGRTKLTLIFSDAGEKRPEAAQTVPTRIGFLKGRISVAARETVPPAPARPKMTEAEELAYINRNADRLNAEAEDVLAYQDLDR